MKRILVWTVCLLALVEATWAQAPGTTVLIGAGGSFPLSIYTRWFEEYQKIHPGWRFHYIPMGSGEGIKQVTAGLADFGGSDAPLTNAEIANSKIKILHFPTVLGAVVPTYNVPGLRTPLRVTPEILAGIFLGTIRRWNHPAIAAANPDIRLPAADIRVVHRMEPSGTTYIWTDYLNKVSPEWKAQVGKGSDVSWPVGVGARGNRGMAERVKQTDYSIGYCELTYALQNAVSYGLVRNAAGNFISADLQSVTAAASGSGLTIPDDFRASITNAPGRGAYPIASFTWLLVPARIESNKRKALKEFLYWMLTSGQGISVESLGYAKLPDEVVQKELQAIARIQ